jgi:carbamoyltransferase
MNISNKPIYILSIYSGHNCTAALLKNGKILSVISEERFNRKKNYVGFPTQSIKWVLDYEKITLEDVELIAVCGENFVMGDPLLNAINKTSLNVASKIYGSIEYNLGNSGRHITKIKTKVIDNPSAKRGKALFKKMMQSEFNIPESKLFFVEHHACHAYAAYYGQSEEREKAIILTLDGEGDESCATVNEAEGYNVKRISSTWRHNSLGYIYSLTTKFMGMTPLEHEYKVMGLAPYAATKEQKYFMKTYNKVFKDVIWIDKNDPLKFKSKFPTGRFEQWLRKKAVGERFDNMAGALQHLTETLVAQWVTNVVKKTGNGNIYCGGGVFMNVKTNMILSELPEIKNIHVLPSCSDDSNPIGAAYFAYIKLCKDRGITPTVERIKDIYLGPDFDDEAEDYINKNNIKSKYIVQQVTPKLIAEMLSKGEIIARCAGRMEWGARSLGNRCIMANPSDLKYVWTINEQIKMRDFWMPFAPTILKERANDYIENPKNLEAPYMIMAFKSTELAKKELRAAMHQADFTVRPQLIERSWNSRYYDIIKEFEKITGIGGILNTSFNLHGKPIVMTPKDAVEETMENSGLQHLILGDFLISKKK